MNPTRPGLYNSQPGMQTNMFGPKINDACGPARSISPYSKIGSIQMAQHCILLNYFLLIRQHT